MAILSVSLTRLRSLGWLATTLTSLLITFPTAAHAQLVGLDALNATGNISDTAHTRRVFYLGGQYTGPANATRFTGQVYTEELLPVGGAKQQNPLIFLHQGFTSGAQWLQTPDNRPGWASYFLSKGYAVYLVDVAAVGRSSRPDDVPVNPATSVQTFQDGFTAPEKAKPAPLYPQAALHTQFPGTGLRGDPIFDLLYASLIPTPNLYNDTEAAVQTAICSLLTHLPPSYLIAHAYGGFFPYLITDACPTSVQGILGLDVDPSPFRSIDGAPAKPYGLTDIPITYSPPVTNTDTDLPHQAFGTSASDRSFSNCELQTSSPPKTLPNLQKTPILHLISEAGPKATVGHCQPTYLRQAGVPVSLVYLPEVGIKGNGQLFPLEKNNLDIAAFAEGWFQSRAGDSGKANLTDISTSSGTTAHLQGLLGLNSTFSGGL